MTDLDALTALDRRVVECRACPRLVSWREQVAREKRAAFAHETYWGRPVPGFGDPEPTVLVVGLAPAAHGANRTGRMFTGDPSGDWLFAALHAVGVARLPTATSADDGQELTGFRLCAPVRCAPPANKPTPQERATCAPWLDEELALVGARVRAVVALGAIGWGAALRALGRAGVVVPRPRPRFGHGAQARLDASSSALGGAGPEGDAVTLVGSYHPSRHNTATGRLTAPMLEEVLGRARDLGATGAGGGDLAGPA
ncbi:uracil-DNA glycosylase [Nocardioides bruguierae]|uniref:Type-5 uracil-DNA glycosylase n=1 Tax=Nocardioides bruguierae TaxID=2945102 RepID=A0A9X2IEF1_9ACTN|nr:uracil-DNA glycosylase [Nocardioides bruguierae]MCM0619988.1 uracil-DNA glycosylase [Nocardioides bruguierae]